MKLLKIWHQSLTSIENIPAYRDAVVQHIRKVVRPDVEVVLHGMSNDTYPSDYPGHFITYSYLQNLHKEQFIRNALIAENAGYDCVFIGTIPDVGLLEARSLVDIPVIGYGQASLHVASLLGNRIGIVNFLEPLADQLRFNAKQYGLAEKLGPIVQTNVGFYDVLSGFDNPEPVLNDFIESAKIAIEQGADVIIPGEGPMNIFLATNGITKIDDVPIIDSFAVGLKMCEMLTDLKEKVGLSVTRKGFYNAKPPEEAVKKLRAFYGQESNIHPELDFGYSVKHSTEII